MEKHDYQQRGKTPCERIVFAFSKDYSGRRIRQTLRFPGLRSSYPFVGLIRRILHAYAVPQVSFVLAVFVLSVDHCNILLKAETLKEQVKQVTRPI